MAKTAVALEKSQVSDNVSSVMTLGQNIRVLRQVRNLTQDELSVLAAMKRPQISKLERGHIGIQLDTLDRLAAALGVPAWELLRPRDGAGR
jgi:transcriptional regulator with XRE-family HTH domain